MDVAAALSTPSDSILADYCGIEFLNNIHWNSILTWWPQTIIRKNKVHKFRVFTLFHILGDNALVIGLLLLEALSSLNFTKVY